MPVPALYAKLGSRVRRLRDDESGNVAVIFALALMPLVGLVGAAVDYSHANSIKTAMQAATDATALKLAKAAGTLSDTQLAQQATNNFNVLFTRPETTGVQIGAQYDTANKSLSLTATGSMKTDFMGLMGFSSLTISTRAVAKPVGAGTACVLVLNANASGAVTVQGGNNVNLAGCSLYANSKSGSAITVGGSASLSALSVGVVGGISGGAAITATQGVSTGGSPVADPYSTLAIPSFSGCNATNFTAHGTVTINPGVYCGGMQLNANARVTLNPGIYYIDHGDFSMNGGAVMTGTGVTLIFTSSTMSNWPKVTINGGATVNLTPPTTGPTAGIVMFADRNIPVGTTFKFNGGASQYIGGAVYIPTGDVTYAGGASSSTSCTKLIADTITFTGNSNFAINCDAYGTKAFGPTGVRLVS
jgi:Flp pilus assembly protein TadG